MNFGKVLNDGFAMVVRAMGCIVFLCLVIMVIIVMIPFAVIGWLGGAK